MSTPPEPPEKRPFGGKSPAPLAWNPMLYMDEFLENLRIEEATEDYIRMVRVGLIYFADFCASQKVVHPDEITRSHLLGFQAHIQSLTKANGEKYAQSYRQQLLKYVRIWINWLAEVGYIDTNPWVRIKVGTTPKKPKPLEDDEIATLFQTHRSQAFSIPPFSFHRREVILVLLYGWGLRIHELASLTVTQMDMRQDWVTVRNKSQRSKGKGVKVEPYGDMLKQVVQRYLKVRAKYAVHGQDSLLIGSEGQPLSTQMIRKIVTELGDRAGISVNPHRFRDTFGTTMLDHDVEVERIMAMMGHTQRSQTMAYSRVNNPKIKESHDRVINPLLERLLGA